MAEESLRGGITNAGAVVRDGEHVLRPASAHVAAIHAFLRAIRDQGFTGAPLPIGIDPDGRERLEFIPGDVPTSPYPAWAQTDEALASVAALLRRFHDASSAFTAEREGWNQVLADPDGGRAICHNDLELSNVVFRHGRAVALIDFEFAAPGRAIYDVAQLARLCVPIEHDVDRERMGWAEADRPARLRLIADAYGLDPSTRPALVPAVDDALRVIERAARQRRTPVSEETGGLAKYDRRRSWWAEHRHRFVAALR
ncbi:MAG: phosphotransferase [Actinomycetota bacterium]